LDIAGSKGDTTQASAMTVKPAKPKINIIAFLLTFYSVAHPNINTHFDIPFFQKRGSLPYPPKRNCVPLLPIPRELIKSELRLSHRFLLYLVEAKNILSYREKRYNWPTSGWTGG
jgi:hypothetical protein